MTLFMPITWRDLETALHRVGRANGWHFDRHSDAGDLMCYSQLNPLNLTLLAKELAEELEGK